MRVRMKSRLATPTMVALPNDVIEVTAQQGADLIAGKYAEAVKEPVTRLPLVETQKQAEEPEVAAMDAGETPEGPPVPRRRRGRAAE